MMLSQTSLYPVSNSFNLDDVKITKAEPEHFIQALELFVFISQETELFPFFADEPFEKSRDYLFSFKESLYVATFKEQLIGAYFFKPIFPGWTDHVVNAGYYVHPSGRSKGVGRLLLKHSLEMTKSLGFEAIQFNFVVNDNQAAVMLYQSEGFNIIGRVPKGFLHPQKGYLDLLIMHRFL